MLWDHGRMFRPPVAQLVLLGQLEPKQTSTEELYQQYWFISQDPRGGTKTELWQQDTDSEMEVACVKLDHAHILNLSFNNAKYS